MICSFWILHVTLQIGVNSTRPTAGAHGDAQCEESNTLILIVTCTHSAVHCYHNEGFHELNCTGI